MGKNSRHEEPNNQADPRIPSGTDKGPVKRRTKSGFNTEERRIQQGTTPPYPHLDPLQCEGRSVVEISP
jgi:hypothetical protein